LAQHGKIAVRPHFLPVEVRTIVWFITSLMLLAVATSNAESLYKIDTGPYPVRTIEAVTINDPVQERDITLRLLIPDGDGPFPLVVYSTGMFCFPQMYDRIIGHWASHGYAVMEPNHRDSPNNDRPPSMDELETIVASRVRDVSAVVDSIDDIEKGIDRNDFIDRQRVAIGGHSFGAVVSMIKSGLIIKDEYRGDWGEPADERFQAAVLMSTVGPSMQEFADNAFDGLQNPFIATGGTRDVGRVDLGDLTPAEWRMQAYLLAPPGDKYSVITEGTDHYMGGLICNADRGGEADPAAVATVRAMTTAFLDAYINEDPNAMEFLRTADINALTDGQARYQYR